MQPGDSDEDGVDDTSSSENEEEDALYVRDENMNEAGDHVTMTP